MLAMMRSAPGSIWNSAPVPAPSAVTTAAPATEIANPTINPGEKVNIPAATASPAVTSGLAALRMIAFVARLQWRAR